MNGKIIFISGPSGVGKGTLINHLRERHSEWVFPPSCTTRAPRPDEIEGKTYYFISKKEFEQKIKNNEFLEHAKVHNGNLYGTLKKPLIQGVKQGKIVVREFDVQGFEQAKDALPKEYYISIFLKPDEDDPQVLIKRIKERAPISDEEIQKRIRSMKKELSMEKMYNHTVISINGKPMIAVKEVEKIIRKY